MEELRAEAGMQARLGIESRFDVSGFFFVCLPVCLLVVVCFG
jgi:hypothetical protein